MGRLLNHKNSGGTSRISVTTINGVWVHAPPRGRTWKQWDLAHRNLQKKKNTRNRFYLGIFYFCLKHYVLLSSRFVLLSADARSGDWGSYGVGLAAVRVAAEAALEMGVVVRSTMGLSIGSEEKPKRPARGRSWLRQRREQLKNTAGAAIVFGLRKKGTAVGLLLCGGDWCVWV